MLVDAPPIPATHLCGHLKTRGVGPHGRVDILCPLHYISFDVSILVWLMPPMAEAAISKEVVDEETTCESFLCLQLSGPAGTPVSLPVPCTTQLLTLTSPMSLCPWRCLLAWPGHGPMG